MTQKVTYGTRGVADPLNHKVYDHYLNLLGLKDIDRNELVKRGLSHEHIKNAKYATKGILKETTTMKALADTNANFNLDGVPGFCIDDKTGHRTTALVSGLVIPVFDYNGRIKGLLIRNDRAKVGKNGKVNNKYVNFSTSDKTKGGKVYQTTHCPMVKGNPKDVCGVTARFTEGVLKADIATALGKYYCFGMQGLNVHDDFEVVIGELEVSTIIISLDQGEDESFDMIRAKGRLIKRIKDCGIDVKVELWDKQYGKGIDDIIKAGHEDKTYFASDDEVEQMLKLANMLDPFNGEWRYSLTEKKLISTKTFQQWDKQQFADKFGLVKGDQVSVMLAERKLETVDRTTYWPGKPLFVEDMGLDCMNIWQDPKIDPEQGDISKFLEFMDYLIPNELERKLTLQWLAYMVTNPGDKIHFALMIVGGQGVGKSLLVEMVKNLVGLVNTTTPTPEQLNEGFNGYLKNASLVVSEETMAHGRRDIHNKVKPWITQPTLMIREMNTNAYQYPNRFNLIFLTNFIDALPIDDEDRRFLIVMAAKLKRDDEYYDQMVEWLFNPMTLRNMLFFFQHVDLSDFKAKGKAPETITKSVAISSNLNSLEEFVMTHIADAAYPFNGELGTIRHWRKKGICPPGIEKYSDFKWAQALKKAGAILIDRQITLSDKSRCRLWAYGPQKEVLSNPNNIENIDFLRKQYEKSILDEEPGNPIEQMSPV